MSKYKSPTQTLREREQLLDGTAVRLIGGPCDGYVVRFPQEKMTVLRVLVPSSPPVFTAIMNPAKISSVETAIYHRKDIAFDDMFISFWIHNPDMSLVEIISSLLLDYSP